MMESSKMQISVHDPQTLERIGLLTSWISLVWRENYREKGSFQLEVPFSQEVFELLARDRYLWLGGRSAMMIVKTAQVKDGKIVVNGFCLLRLLKDRVSMKVVGEKKNAEEEMRALFEEMAPFPLLSLGDAAGFEELTTAVRSDMTIEEYAKKIAEDIDCGMRIRKDGRRLLFELYRPGEAQAKYSTRWGNVGEARYTHSTEEYANVAIVAGEGEGDDRVTVTAGDTQAVGLERREMYVDARGQGRKSGETLTQYKTRLVTIGEERLKEAASLRKVSFSVNDDSVELGQIIHVRIPEYSVSAKARIEAIQITAQRGKVKKELIIGDPIVEEEK